MIKQIVNGLSLAMLLGCLSITSVAQKPRAAEPVERELLNKLKVLTWSDTTADNVTIRIRVHSGASFDPAGKEGTACLLTDVMFPGTAIFEDFEESFEGTLKVRCEYDYVQIDAITKADKFVEALNVLSVAVRNPLIDKDTTAAARTARIQKLIELGRDPKYIAEVETAKGFMAHFPMVVRNWALKNPLGR